MAVQYQDDPGFYSDRFEDVVEEPLAQGAAIAPQRAWLQAATAWVGALTSLGLVIGMGYWAYSLTVRDVSGVPVVRALEGPMRVAPDDPGGRQAAHQGLAVNRVAAVGDAAPPAERLMLAPSPVDVLDEDVPLTNRSGDGSKPQEDPVRAALAVLERIGEAPASEESAMVAQPEAETPVRRASFTVPAGLKRSLVPLPRPEGDLAAMAALNAVQLASAPSRPVEVDPATIPDGTYLVQLGVFDSPDVARQEWDRLTTRFESFLQGKQRVVQAASRGGSDFYRLRAVGFDDVSDARRFCAALTAEDAHCIPTVVR